MEYTLPHPKGHPFQNTIHFQQAGRPSTMTTFDGYKINDDGDIVDGDRWLLDVDKLVSDNAPRPSFRNFDKWLSTWEPLKKAIEAHRTELIVTMQYLCDCLGLSEDLMYATLWLVHDRYEHITILPVEFNAGVVRSRFVPNREMNFGKIKTVTFHIDYDGVDESDEETACRKRKYSRDEDEAQPSKRRRTGPDCG